MQLSYLLDHLVRVEGRRDGLAQGQDQSTTFLVTSTDGSHAIVYQLREREREQCYSYSKYFAKTATTTTPATTSIIITTTTTISTSTAAAAAAMTATAATTSKSGCSRSMVQVGVTSRYLTASAAHAQSRRILAARVTTNSVLAIVPVSSH